MYDNSFFKKFPQQPSSFIDDAGEERRYDFPSLYDGSRGMLGIFKCNYIKASST